VLAMQSTVEIPACKNKNGLSNKMFGETQCVRILFLAFIYDSVDIRRQHMFCEKYTLFCLEFCMRENWMIRMFG